MEPEKENVYGNAFHSLETQPNIFECGTVLSNIKLDPDDMPDYVDTTRLKFITQVKNESEHEGSSYFISLRSGNDLNVSESYCGQSVIHIKSEPELLLINKISEPETNETNDLVEIKKRIDDFSPKSVTCVKSEVYITEYYNQPSSSKQSQENSRDSAKDVNKISKKKKQYPCPICRKNFRNIYSRKTHFNIHFRENSGICPFCGQIFVKVEEFIHHYSQHVVHTNRFISTKKSADYMHSNLNRLFKCTVCSKSFIRQFLLRSHLKSHILQTSTGSTDSYVKDEMDIADNDLKIKNDKIDLENRQFKCIFCLKQFAQRTTWRNHLKIHPDDKSVKCEICLKQFTQKAYLTLHMKIHTGEKLFKCEICSKQFTQKAHLNVHLKIHTEEKLFKCEICLKHFTQKAHLNVHLKIHSEEKLFECEICLKKFITKAVLTRHSIIHTGEKPFKCEICFKQFTRKAYLTVHSKIHTGEKQYNCEICFKRFITKPDLTRHSFVHTGEKPFKCEICSKQFTRKAYLTIHLKIHAGEKLFECEFCSKHFVTKTDLTRHLVIHTGEKPFKCDICFKLFSRKAYLTAHMKHHVSIFI